MTPVEFATSAFEDMHRRYEFILQNFRPSRSGVGFTEPNLTHTYMNCLVKQLGFDAIEWLEFPWEKIKNEHTGKFKNTHIDGFVFSKQQKVVFYIESKRLQNPKKIDDLHNDIHRIVDFYKNDAFMDKLKHHIDDPKQYSHYLIILADLWNESTRETWKKVFPQYWKEQKLPEKFNMPSLSIFLNVSRSFKAKRSDTRSDTRSDQEPKFTYDQLFAIANLDDLKCVDIPNHT